jgi:TRAP-type C4-dicarboxylate transport system permease small subunit
VEGLGHREGPAGGFGRVLRLMSLAGGVVLILLMGYTVLDVVLRYGFNRPFSGSLELTEFAMSVIVFLGIAYCGWTGGHVAVDILERPLEDPRLRFIPVLLTLAGAVLFAAIAWLTLAEALSSTHRVSNMMRWPHWPFQLTVAFGAAMYALVLLIQAIRLVPRKPRGSDDVAR